MIKQNTQERSNVYIGVTTGLWWVGMIALSSLFATAYAKGIQITNPQCGIEAMLAGTAYQPYIYRVLTIWILRLLLAGGLSISLGVWLIVTASTIASVLAFRLMTTQFGADQQRVALITPLLIVVMAVLWFSFPYTQLYDMLQVLLFIVSYVLMARRSWLAYLVVFTLACLNKETAALLTIGFAVVFIGQMPWRRYLAIGSAQTAIWLLIRVILTVAFGNNHGVIMENRLDYHLYSLVAMPITIAVYLAMVAGVLVLCFRGWNSKHLELRRLFLVMSPLLAVLYIVGGTPFEFRVFNELVPVVLLLCLPPSARKEQEI